MKGIYIITNKITNESYIGQSKDIAKRWDAHRKKIKDGKYNLYSDMRFYGVNNFDFQALEETNNLNEREMYWIKYYLSKGSKLYNIIGVPEREKSYALRRRNKASFKKY